MLYALVIGYFLIGAAGIALIIMLLVYSILRKNRLIFYLFILVLSLELILEANSINFFLKLLYLYFPDWIGAPVIGCAGYIIFLAAVPLLYFEILKINPVKALKMLFYIPSLFFMMLSAAVFIIPDYQNTRMISLEYTILQSASWIFSSVISILMLTRKKSSIDAWFPQIAAFLVLSPILIFISRYTLLPVIAGNGTVAYLLFLLQVAALLSWMAVLIAGIRANRKISGISVKIPEHFGLTARESEVAVLVIHGLSNLEIAGKLSISPETVKKHVQNIFQKTNSESKIDLANKSVQ